MSYSLGEWSYTRNATDTRWIIESDQGRGIAVTAGFEPDNEANARLISAAPNLLMAGKHLAVKLADVYRAAKMSPAECQAIREWLDAVKKAEGRV